jgi:NAD(P)-dependent dehydrogenase (short-subunit alcohol dehydrogenase family)
MDAEELRKALEVLEAVERDRGLLSELDAEERKRLLTAAGRVSQPERAEQRTLNKAFRRKERLARRAADERVLEKTGVREGRRAPLFVTPPVLTTGSSSQSAAPEPPVEREVVEARKCYVCKVEFKRVHHFYDQMCPPCAELNFEKRSQTGDLRGRTALVTGGRVKIGYQASIMLLRAGARVIVTTRFPHDAAARYVRETDFTEWRDRLAIYGLDLRHTPSVETFARHLEQTEERLDFILHNACQTVRRPVGFYAHLVEGEARPHGSLPAPEQALVAAHHSLRDDRRLADSARLATAPMASDDHLLSGRVDLFPAGRLDQDLQQVDLRAINSWRLTLAEVPTVELLEVVLVNAVAPFVLSARLKALMLRHPSRDKHIVNVSAMEGQFYRGHKTDKHPHTNMAKAALNMLTRTSAADYVRDGIHINSVDTGWVTDEDPIAIAARKVEEHGFHPPLDIVDGAARICDPIFVGLATGDHPWGHFFKDYRPARW